MKYKGEIDMYLKIKEIIDMKLVLELNKGIYTIGTQVPALKLVSGDYITMPKEIIEKYDSMDYKIEEVVERFNIIYEILYNENNLK